MMLVTSWLFMERAKGIEPSSQAWEARILPMNYARKMYILYHIINNMNRFILYGLCCWSVIVIMI